MSNHERAAADLHGDQKVRYRPAAERICYTHDLVKAYGKSERSHRRYLRFGPPEFKDFVEWGRNHKEALRVAAAILVEDYRQKLEGKSTAQVIRIYRQGLADDQRSEAEDACDSLNPEATWDDRRLSSERDGHTDFVVAACCGELKRRGVSTDLLEVVE